MKDSKLSISQKFIIAFTFLFCLTGALLIKENYCPDEYGRKLLSDWICQNGKLPTGNEQELIIDLMIIILVAEYFIFTLIKKKERDVRRVLLDITVILSGIITFALSVYQSYFRDYQPQGRYIITLLITAGYLMARGAEGASGSKDKKEGIYQAGVVSLIWFIMAPAIFCIYMSRMFL